MRAEDEAPGPRDGTGGVDSCQTVARQPEPRSIEPGDEQRRLAVDDGLDRRVSRPNFRQGSRRQDLGSIGIAVGIGPPLDQAVAEVIRAAAVETPVRT